MAVRAIWLAAKHAGQRYALAQPLSITAVIAGLAEITGGGVMAQLSKGKQADAACKPGSKDVLQWPNAPNPDAHTSCDPHGYAAWLHRNRKDVLLLVAAKNMRAVKAALQPAHRLDTRCRA